MKPRTVLLCITAIALGVIAACSGVNVSLGGGQHAQVSTAGSPDMGGSASGGSSTVAGTGASSGLNVGDAGMLPTSCPAGTKTTVSGMVFDPGEHTPLYNAVVYIPDGALPPLPKTVACETCKDPIQAKDVALSDSSGAFTLSSVPIDNQVQLVVQLGKWRSFARTFPIKPCQANPGNDLHLPKDRTEGDIPKIALSTGHSDALECLLRKIGIADTEFTTDAGSGSVNMFVGCAGDQSDMHTGASMFDTAHGGQAFPSVNQLFDTPGELDKYDVVIFSCEGHKCDKASANAGKPGIQTPAHVAQLIDYANRGGRVYLDHDHYNWLNNSNLPIESAAQFSSSPDGVPSPLTAKINAVPAFPKGQDFAQWLVNVKASSTLGEMQIFSGKTSVQSITTNRAQSWIYRAPPDFPDWPDFFYLTIGTPVAVKDSDPAPTACGRVVFTDLHVSKSGGGCPDAGTACGESDDTSDEAIPFPQGCTSVGLLPQEKALEFMIFDLSSCVQKETDPPIMPPIVVK